MREMYKRFYLNAGANELQYRLGWSPKLIIEKHDGKSVTATDIVSARGLFKTEGEAIDAALRHGRDLIDHGFRSE